MDIRTFIVCVIFSFHTAMAHGPLRYHFVLLILNTVQGSDDDHEQRRKAKELKPSDGNG